MKWNAQRLNDTQVGVLTWVRDGCPDGVYVTGWEHRITARALERHGLVTLRGHGPSWTARITPMGHSWLKERTTDVAAQESDAAELLRQVAEAGGSLTVAATGQDLERWRRRVRATNRAPERPYGKRLVMKRVGYWAPNEHFIALADYFEELVTTRAVPVPARVARYHPVVRSYLDDRDWQYVSDEHLRRAGLILQAVAAEAERRGMQVLAAGDVARNEGQPIYKAPEGHLWLFIEEHEYSIEIREVAAKGGARRDHASRIDHRLPKWMERRRTEFLSTGRLQVILKGRMAPYDGLCFGDAPKRTVEVQLPALFGAIDRLQLEAKHADEDTDRKKNEEAARRDQERVRARAEFASRKRWEYFVELAERHDEAARFRAFLEVAEVASEALDGEARVAVKDYLAEIREGLRSRDPIESPGLLVPVIREPSDRELGEFIAERNGHVRNFAQ